jgi:hypothetical protein
MNSAGSWRETRESRPQPHPGSATVLCDELNPSLFQSLLHRVHGGTRDVAPRFFKIDDCRQAEACGLGELRLGDVQQRARSATLSGCDRMSNTY